MIAGVHLIVWDTNYETQKDMQISARIDKVIRRELLRALAMHEKLARVSLLIS